MNGVKTSRVAGLAWLLAGTLASLSYLAFARTTEAPLQKQGTAASTTSDYWLDYARQVESQGDYEQAAAAYAKALEMAPFCQEALLRRPVCLAASGATNELVDTVAELVLSHAKLAVLVLDTAELASYLEQPPFPSLLSEARSQAVD